LAGISDDKIKEICEKNNISDENLIKAISEIISENNEELSKMPGEVFGELIDGMTRILKTRR